MTSFFMPDCLPESMYLSHEESRHAVKSLRLKEGDDIQVLNGKGRVYQAQILDANDKKLRFEIRSFLDHDRPKPILDLAVSPLKFPDRYEFMVEKACEMGIRSITPLICHRSERKKLKLARMQRIAISALKQSENPFLTEIRDGVELSDFLLSDSNKGKFAAHLSKNIPLRLPSVTVMDSNSVLIGPEGGFTEKEASMIQNSGYEFIDLGPHILRTESAAMAVSAYFHMLMK